MLAKMQRKGNPLTLLVGIQTSAATLGIVWRFLRNLKLELHYEPAVALLDIFQTIWAHAAQCYSAMSTIADLWQEP